MTSADAGGRRQTLRLTAAGLALGFGLGGFFDGILLHQVLQWHHLLSNVEQARQDIRVLILADGLFHVLMYLVTGVGLWLLWRSRHEFANGHADRRLLSAALVGFGVWHVVDGVLSHWILGIHRIRMDVENPLFWDVAWLVVFGVLPIVAGWRLPGRRPSPGRTVMSAPAALVFTSLLAGPIAALPPPGQDSVVVLFRPDVSEAHAYAAMRAVDGRLLGVDASGQLWAMEFDPGSNPSELYRYGALLVSGAMLPLGCFSWIAA